ncbi:MAG: hypothetical protein QW594_01640 [Candidatus Woesearchaeota archaeon]
MVPITSDYDDYDFDENPDRQTLFIELDEKNRQRNSKNIISKKKVSKYELDEIFAHY